MSNDWRSNFFSGFNQSSNFSEVDKEHYKYHNSQWETVKRSTVAFERFAHDHLSNSRSVIDIGAGAGASTAAIAANHRNVQFTALDISIDLINTGSQAALERGVTNISFEHGDLFNYKGKSVYDGCICLQTLSWLEDYKEPLEIIFREIRPNWLGLTSLFYEGDISCRIEVFEIQKNCKYFYNVYSLPAIAKLCFQEGYSLVKAIPFEIDIDIPKPPSLDVMGTYTRKLASDGFREQRLQISGPLLMPWFMLLIERQ